MMMLVSTGASPGPRVPVTIQAPEAADLALNSCGNPIVMVIINGSLLGMAY